MWVYARVNVFVCVCVCMCGYVCVRAYVRLSVYEVERERERVHMQCIISWKLICHVYVLQKIFVEQIHVKLN